MKKSVYALERWMEHIKKVEDLGPMCAYGQDWSAPETLGEFETMEEAKKAYDDLSSVLSVRLIDVWAGKTWEVEEVVIARYDYTAYEDEWKEEGWKDQVADVEVEFSPSWDGLAADGYYWTRYGMERMPDWPSSDELEDMDQDEIQDLVRETCDQISAPSAPATPTRGLEDIFLSVDPNGIRVDYDGKKKFFCGMDGTCTEI